jgi:hypothetical protein
MCACLDASLTPSIGAVADALDNALAKTTRRYKTECIRDGSPFRTRPLETVADIEKIASQWVNWHNTSRLMHRLGRRPPAEAEAEYHHCRAGHRPRRIRNEACMKPGSLHCLERPVSPYFATKTYMSLVSLKFGRKGPVVFTRHG